MSDLQKQYKKETGKDVVSIIIDGHNEKAFTVEYVAWLENKLKTEDFKCPAQHNNVKTYHNCPYRDNPEYQKCIMLKEGKCTYSKYSR